MNYYPDTLQALERRFRANLINSIGGFKSLVLLGTVDAAGTENLAPFSSLFHLGADPALCGLIFRPGEPGRNTLGNILHTGSYTVNHVLPSFYRQAHQCSAKYPEGVSEFAATGLHAEYLPGITAPFVAESVIRFACEPVQTVDIELNGTRMLIGKIVHLEVPDACIGADGYVDIEAAGSITCSGLDTYHRTQRIGRLSYARADRMPEDL